MQTGWCLLVWVKWGGVHQAQFDFDRLQARWSREDLWVQVTAKHGGTDAASLATVDKLLVTFERWAAPSPLCWPPTHPRRGPHRRNSQICLLQPASGLLSFFAQSPTPR